MARFRQYKNGIYGHRHKDYYVIRNEKAEKKKTYSIIDEQMNIIEEGVADYWDCIWEIDKMEASPKEEKIMRSLYNEEIHVLSKIFVHLMEKDNTQGLTADESTLYDLVTKIRARKAQGKPY